MRLENTDTGLKLEWDAIAALLVVEQESGVKVAHAAEWARGCVCGSPVVTLGSPRAYMLLCRQAASSSSGVSVQKPFDWTYTTRHPGSLSNAEASTSALSPPTALAAFVLAPLGHPGIPLHLLARQDIPILFFDEVPLFEDELGDNGIAELVVRVVRSLLPEQQLGALTV